MNKYIKKFEETGASEVNVDVICADWNDNFTISCWENEDHNKYTLLIYGKNKTSNVKTVISQEQANEIIKRLSLIRVKDSVFRSGSDFYSRSYIDKKRAKLSKMKEEKERELIAIKELIYCYESAK